MRTYRPVQLASRELVSATCDCCEKVFRADGDEEELIELQELRRIGFTSGYGSVFGDGVSMGIDLCQHCIEELLGPFLRVEARPA